MFIRASGSSDVVRVLQLYRQVAEHPGGLARLASEINEAYVETFLTRAHENGLSLVTETEQGRIVGEVHAYPPGPACFSHVLSDLTIAVAPSEQGRGTGRRLFEAFLEEVERSFPHVLRVELIARESNRRAIEFYRSLRFTVEGSFRSRIRNVDGSFEADIPMAWLRE